MIRLACGDGLRKAETLPEFVARVKRRTGVSYDPSTVSLLERNKQKWRLDDVRAFAAVDPLGRGEAWLAFGDPSPASILPNPALDRVLTPAEEQRALRRAEELAAEREARQAATKPKKRKA